MKSLFKLFIVIFLFSTTSCHAQKMMQSVKDAKKLELNKEQFIGKPLKALLDQIEPKIKFVYGNPENKSAGIVGGTYIKFFFIDKDSVKGKLNKNEKPTGITVNFFLDLKNIRKPIPTGGININSSELKKKYGEMIIQDIYVSGED